MWEGWYIKLPCRWNGPPHWKCEWVDKQITNKRNDAQAYQFICTMYSLVHALPSLRLALVTVYAIGRTYSQDRKTSENELTAFLLSLHLANIKHNKKLCVCWCRQSKRFNALQKKNIVFFLAVCLLVWTEFMWIVPWFGARSFPWTDDKNHAFFAS